MASVGAGHAREAHGSTAVRSGTLKSYFAVDQDLDSLHVAEKDYGVIPVHSSVRGICEQGSIAEQVDLILAGGLYDYLTERTAIPLTRCLIDSLAPGGVLHIANIVRGFGDAALLEAVMDWPLVHRDEQDMRALLSEVATDRIDTITLHRDPDDVMTFMEVHLR
ncbi:hypothetical protein BOX37_17100 [Nocardia mangyaensis]|uniref:Uncharacterized protein n=1 Tax=Nocardia mangyaensis TaxID=2213200 RepID=A0A1J0VTX1_9NOCA|nr:hypothetical protein BOX37_17100 [Nocardia mangyaensis]